MEQVRSGWPRRQEHPSRPGEDGGRRGQDEEGRRQAGIRHL
jgi:hypothetical protein